MDVKLLREPLVHFLVLGGLIFAVSWWFGNPGQQASREIVIDEGQVQRLVEGWKMTWQRPPTQEEMERLIDDFITEEILYREALEMGLDRDDLMIRRRLRQKMEFISEDLASQVEPNDEELEAYLAENSEYFRSPPEFSFEHIYLNPGRRGEQWESDASSMLALLNGPQPPERTRLGDPFPLPSMYEEKQPGEIDRLFGNGFAEQMGNQPLGRWFGPVVSGYGAHLVRIQRKTESRLPSLDEIRPIVVREFVAARRREVNSEFVRRLREQYTIVFDDPDLKAETAEVR